jgi:glycosyltransferase involved in cell wall biosynthesis
MALSAARQVSRLKRRLVPLQRGAWTQHFNADLYLALNLDLKNMTASEAVWHFRFRGYLECRQFSSLGDFDYDFYVGIHPDLSDFSKERAFKHWLLHGISEGRPHNTTMLLRQCGFASDHLPDDVYSFFDGAYTIAERWRRIRTFLTAAEFTENFSEICATLSAQTLKQLMMHFRMRGQQEKALLLLERLLEEADFSDATVEHYAADYFRERGLKQAAIKLYSVLIRDGGATPWAYLLAADLLSSIGDEAGAIGRCLAGIKAFPGNELLREKLRRLARDAYDVDLKEAQKTLDTLGASRRVEEIMAVAATKLQVRLKTLYADLPSWRRENRKIHSIAILAYPTPVQCFDYRVRQKIEALNLVGIQCKWFDLSGDHNFLNECSEFDAVIFFRCPAFGNILEYLTVAHTYGLITIFEIDDLIVDPSIYPPESIKMGGFVLQEEFKRLRFDPILFSTLAAKCQYGFSSTPLIQKALASLVLRRRAFTIKNGLSASARPTETPVGSDRITIFYGSGSRSHSAHFYNGLAQALLKVMLTNSAVELRIIGPLQLGPDFDPVMDRIHQSHQILKKAEYMKELSNASINLLPLADDAFNKGKSNIKWLEAAAFGIPSVVSAHVFEEDSIQDDEAVFCSSSDDWEAALAKLASSPYLRSQIGGKAKLAAFSRYCLERVSADTRVALDVMEQEESGSVKNAPVRVMIVNVHFAPQAYGGATRVVLDDIAEMRRLYGDSVEVSVFTSIGGAEDDRTFRLYAHEETIVCGVKAPQATQEASTETDIGIGELFQRFIKLTLPNIIHFHCIQNLSVSMLDVARWEGIPYIVTVHDGWWISDEQFLMDGRGELVLAKKQWGQAKRLDRLLKGLKEANQVIAVSETFAELYRSRTQINVLALENPVRPLPVFARPTGQSIVVGMLGGLAVAKGADLLRNALYLKKFPGLSFVIVDHQAQEGLERVEYWGKNRVLIVGRFSQDKVFKFYEGIDVLCAPSICFESFGLSVREALCAQRWVVVSDRGALSQPVINDENGYIIDVNCEAALIRTLNQLNGNFEKFRAPSAGMKAGATSADQVERLMTIYRRFATNVG